jgi:hypothetical protein
MNRWDVSDQLNDCELLKKDSVSWGWLVNWSLLPKHGTSPVANPPDVESIWEYVG